MDTKELVVATKEEEEPVVTLELYSTDHTASLANQERELAKTPVDPGAVIIIDPSPFNNPPTVFITKPLNGQVFNASDRIDLHATAVDIEDGDISGGASIQWYLTPHSRTGGSRASHIATGGNTRIFRNTLPPGTHTLEAVARDSRGRASAPSRVVITILGAIDVDLPAVDIIQPQQGQLIDISWDITLQATSVSAPRYIIQWVIDGLPIVTRPRIPARELGIGNHTIGAFVIDSSTGLSSSVDTVEISIVRMVIPPPPPPPVVTIVKPSRNQQFQLNQDIPLLASVIDPWNLFSPVHWLVDGLIIGPSSSIPARSLGIGAHTIGGFVMDSQGLRSMIATVSIYVNGPIQMNKPVVTIFQPTPYQVFNLTQNIPLVASVSDLDEILSTASIQWLVDGSPIASRPFISARELGVGPHAIGAFAFDSTGLQSDIVPVPITIVDVDPPAINTDPVVKINEPSRGAIFHTDGYIKFDASATDKEDGFLTNANVQWRSHRDGDLGQGQRIRKDAGGLTLGRHIVSVTATDSAGRTATAAVSIQITDGPKVTITSPRSGLAFRDQSIDLQVVATTWTGGQINDSDITWYTIRNAPAPWTQIATGRKASVNAQSLGIGTHEIVAVAKDGLDQGVDSVFITINSPNATPARSSGNHPGTVHVRRNTPP